MSIDLISCDVRLVPPFSFLPDYSTLIFNTISDRILSCTGTRDAQDESVCVELLLRKEEAAIWHACSQMVEFHVLSTKERLKGAFQFDLVGIEFYQGLSDSDWAHMRTVIVNHAQNLAPGASTWIKYRSVYGVLKKLVPLEWGKISFSHCVRVHDKPEEKIDLHIKKLLKGKSTGYIMVHDISRTPIFDRADTLQQSRLQKLFLTMANAQIPYPRVIMSHGDRIVASSDEYTVSEPDIQAE